MSRVRALTTRPTVSVVVPCYNYGRFLPEVVHDLLGQPGVDVEVVIVDDCSTDDSAAVARRLEAEDARVRVIVHEVNRGHIATYNDGLADVRGDYVVLLSADDKLTPGSLQRSVALMEAHPNVGLVYGFARSFDRVAPTPRTSPTSWIIWSGRSWAGRLCRRGRNVITNPEVVIRGSLARELGGYDERLPHSADVLMWLRAAVRADVGRINGVDQAYYRVHGDNMHLNDFGGVLADLVERSKAFDLLFADPSSAVLAPELKGSARAAIAREALRIASQLADDPRALPSSATPSDFRALAERLDPGVRRTREWRAYERRSDDGISTLRQAWDSQVRDLQSALRWRLWRRYGL